VIDLAHRIDSGENIELDTQSKTNEDEIITPPNQEGQELKSDHLLNLIHIKPYNPVFLESLSV
jgi:hypothetical protein